MMNPLGKRWLVVLVIVAAVAAAQAQDAGPAGDEMLSDDELNALFDQVSVDDLRRMADEANLRRLKIESQQAVTEIRQGLLYDPEQIDQAAALLEQADLADRQEVIVRINRALAMVDDQFAEGLHLLTAGDPSLAATALEQCVDENETSVLSAAKWLAYGDALRRAGRGEAAAEAYRHLLTEMAERISFAASAAVRAGSAFDDTGRLRYAKEMYDYALTNYGLSMRPEEIEWLLRRLEALETIYSDPLAAVTDRMGQAQEQLAASDSGEHTRNLQEEATTILGDLVQTMQEREQQQNSSSDQQQDQSEEKQRQDGQGQKPKGQQPGQKPSSPLQDSRIVPGQTPEELRLTEVHDSDESGDWASLPPRKREEIQKILRQKIATRYRRLVFDYHERLTDEGSD